jgi:prohibitin 2
MNKRHVVLGLLGIAAVLVLMITGGSFVVLNPGERGVVVRMGRVTDIVYSEGLNFKWPFIDQVDRMNVQTRVFEAKNLEASSKDLQQVHTSVAVNYQLNPLMVGKVRQQLGLDTTAYEATVFMHALQESVKAITTQHDARDLVEHRQAVREEMSKLFQAKLDAIIQDGFQVTGFSISNFVFSEVYNRAIEAKVEANERALKAENEVRQAHAEAQKQIAQASGEADSTRLRAQAEADAIRIRAAALRENPEILRLEVLQRWNGELPRVISGESTSILMPFLPGETAPAATSVPASRTPPSSPERR